MHLPKLECVNLDQFVRDTSTTGVQNTTSNYRCPVRLPFPFTYISPYLVFLRLGVFTRLRTLVSFFRNSQEQRRLKLLYHRTSSVLRRTSEDRVHRIFDYITSPLPSRSLMSRLFYSVVCLSLHTSIVLRATK